MKHSIALGIILSVGMSVLVIAGNVSASATHTGTIQLSPVGAVPTPRPTPIVGHVATAAELQKAQSEWLHSRHANTFDDGQGANTTCASCKSPRNWDPTAIAAEDQALDCNACKRVPGAPRPALESGTAVPEADWHNVDCGICHIPVGNSYTTGIAFWNQATGQYESVSSTTELCAKCHTGTHGFEVVEEQAASPAHKGWDCTQCHGAHGSPSACTNCHDPTVGRGAQAHVQHPGTNCTACHDAGGLSIWDDPDAGSRHADEYVPVRFAHALRSWTSHDLSAQVLCQRCHHPRPDGSLPVVARVVCTDCHSDGASLFWCTNFRRNPDPNAAPISVSK
jgi:hypothetical protein